MLQSCPTLCDPRDGSPPENLALTWMNVFCDGKPWTPRTGYAIEVNGLWYNALRYGVELLKAADKNNPHLPVRRRRRAAGPAGSSPGRSPVKGLHRSPDNHISSYPPMLRMEGMVRMPLRAFFRSSFRSISIVTKPSILSGPDSWIWPQQPMKSRQSSTC